MLALEGTGEAIVVRGVDGHLVTPHDVWRRRGRRSREVVRKSMSSFSIFFFFFVVVVGFVSFRWTFIVLRRCLRVMARGVGKGRSDFFFCFILFHSVSFSSVIAVVKGCFFILFLLVFFHFVSFH